MMMLGNTGRGGGEVLVNYPSDALVRILLVVEILDRAPCVKM